MVSVVKRLRYYCDFDDDIARPLLDLPGRTVDVARGTDLVVAGENPGHGFIVETGWAIRCTYLSDGRRQVLNVLMPGDIFDLQVFVSGEADHTVTAVTDMTVKTFRPDHPLALFHSHGKLGQALWWTAVQEEAILREQIVRNGRRNASERIAHFLLEMHRRALIVNEGDGAGFRLPLTQSVIGDALGLTAIHVNRILMKFRDRQLIARSGQWIELLDRDGLVALCDFDPSYLRLDSFPRRLSLAVQGNGSKGNGQTDRSPL
ncbi:MAG: helix-turn-helix domain-containing protein [Alphaproteobacteria bacterium]|nr:helix-turn-helix domain-containing protein [Alphaproteobacteria bacterium]